MAKAVIFAALSLDGFIAADHTVGPLFDWYNNGDVAVTFSDEERVLHIAAATADFSERDRTRSAGYIESIHSAHATIYQRGAAGELEGQRVRSRLLGPEYRAHGRGPIGPDAVKCGQLEPRQPPRVFLVADVITDLGLDPANSVSGLEGRQEPSPFPPPAPSPGPGSQHLGERSRIRSDASLVEDTDAVQPITRTLRALTASMTAIRPGGSER